MLVGSNETAGKVTCKPRNCQMHHSPGLTCVKLTRDTRKLLRVHCRVFITTQGFQS